MKRLIAITFLIVFAFNSFGYLALLIGLQLHYSHELEKEIDTGEYSGSDAMIAKVPLSLPYPINFNGYEKVSGAFECNGEMYQLVKQNLVNDTLYIVFIKDKKGSVINKSLTDFTKNQTNGPLSKTASKLIDSLAKQIFSNAIQLQHLNDGWCLTFIYPLTHQAKDDWEQSINTPPPRV